MYEEDFVHIPTGISALRPLPSSLRSLIQESWTLDAAKNKKLTGGMQIACEKTNKDEKKINEVLECKSGQRRKSKVYPQVFFLLITRPNTMRVLNMLLSHITSHLLSLSQHHLIVFGHHFK